MLKFSKNNIFLLLILIIGVSCNQNKSRFQKVDVSDIEAPKVNIDRYEKALFSIDTTHFDTEINKLQQSYTIFLGNDSIKHHHLQKLYNYVTDTQLIKLYRKINTIDLNYNELEDELSKMLKYYYYYFPKSKKVSVYTYISGLDVNYPVIFADSVMLISIDMYLGKDFPPYVQINMPAYKRRNYQPAYIPVDCAEAISEHQFQHSNGSQKFMKAIIEEGKKLYFKDALLPYYSDTLKIKYTQQQLEWCKNNEKQIWTFLIESDMLYSGQYSKFQKLLTDGPFTAEFGRDSAPRIGHWVGWQIVRKYMENNPTVTLQDLIDNNNYQSILKQSGYKPK